MENVDQTNPYAAPEVEVVTVENNVDILKRSSVVATILLSIVTLGIYYIYWLYTRTASINMVCQNKISNGFIILAIISFVASFCSGFAQGLYPESQQIEMATAIINIVATIISIVWLFSVRSRLNDMTFSKRGDTNWAGPILTFFFQIYYLQYKINRIQDQEADKA